MKRFGSRLLPLILLAALGLLTWALNEVARFPAKAQRQHTGDPDVILQNLHQQRFDEHGRPLFALDAKRARYFTNDDSAWFDQAVFVYTATGSPRVDGHTPRVQALDDGDRLWFPDQLDIIRAADGEHAQLNLVGQQVWMNTRDQTAWSDARVSADSGPYRTTAIGFASNMKTGQLSLKSKVRSQYDPPTR
ncbi:LPS export ABC transporter periplasmic protein LptC [Chitinibacteraceae bacterium HSL-7]